MGLSNLLDSPIAIIGLGFNKILIIRIYNPCFTFVFD